MENIKDLTQLKDLIKENKARFQSVSKNNLLMLSEMETRIQKGDISFEWLDDGLLIFQDEKRYYKLYYYMNDGSCIPQIKTDKLVLIEEAQNNQADIDDVKVERFLSSRFVPYKRNVQVVKELYVDDQRFCQPLWEFRYAEYSYNDQNMQDQVNAASRLWFEYLNETDIPEQHRVVGDGDYILCVYDSDEKMAATHWWNIRGRLSEGRHTVTIPQYYRRGIASVLLNLWCQSAAKHGARRAVTWISDKNVKSLNLYTKMGFRQSGKVINQYIREEK